MVRSSGLQEKAIFAVMEHVFGESLGRHPITLFTSRSDHIPYHYGSMEVEMVDGAHARLSPATQLLPPSTYARIVGRSTPSPLLMFP